MNDFERDIENAFDGFTVLFSLAVIILAAYGLRNEAPAPQYPPACMGVVQRDTLMRPSVYSEGGATVSAGQHIPVHLQSTRVAGGVQKVGEWVFVEWDGGSGWLDASAVQLGREVACTALRPVAVGG